MDYALSGRFEAPASVSKQSIMQQIGNLAVSRFSAAQAGAGALSFWYESRELVEEIYSNAVSFNITATSATGYGGQPDGSTGLFTGLQNFGLKPPGSTGQSQAIGPYGGDGTDYTSGVIAAAVAPFDTCKQTSGGGGPGGGGGNGVNQPPNLPPGTVGYLPNTAPPPGGTMGILNNNVSEDHLSAPYLAWHEVISYEIDNRIIALIPKQDGGVTVLQKTGTSQLTTIQCGYATRMGVPPVPAQPLKGPYDMIQSAYIAPAGREPIGNNPYDVFTLEWRYVIRSAINLESLGVANLNLCYGTDPRRSDDPTVTGPNVDFTGIELIEGAQGAQGS
jgi:hypothetical protein